MGTTSDAKRRVRGLHSRSLTHTRGPPLYTPIIGSSFLGFMQTAIFSRLAHSRNCALSSPAEVHRWKSATWAATPRQPMWSNDALNSRRFWATTWLAHRRVRGRPPGWLETRTIAPGDHPHAHSSPAMPRTPLFFVRMRTVPGDARRTRSHRHWTQCLAHPHLPRRPTHVALHGLRTRLTPSRNQARPTLPSRSLQGRQTQHGRHPERRQTGLATRERALQGTARKSHLPAGLAALQRHAVQRSQRSPMPSCSFSDASSAGDNMWLPLFEIGYNYRMGPIRLPLSGQYAVRQLSASCHFGLMLAPIAHESVMKASTIPLDRTSVD